MTSPAPDATTAATAKAPRHVFTTFIRSTPDLVWRALTESEFTTRYWYGSSAHGEWTPGSPYEYRTGDQVAIDGVVREADRPRRLAMTFRSAWGGPSDDAPSDLTFEIDESGPGVVKLTVIHENISARDARISEVVEGWPYILAGLKTLLETGEPMATPDWG